MPTARVTVLPNGNVIVKEIGSEGLAIYEIKVFEDTNQVVVGDNKFIWEIPEDLHGAEIIKVEAFNTTVGSGSTQIQIRHGNAGAVGTDILSTKITIDSGEYNSKDSSTQPVISGGTVVVAWGDHLHIDVDAAGSGARGLGLIVTLTNAPLGSVTIQGSQGPPGGVTQFQGSWTTSTVYNAGDVVIHNSVAYIVTANHTSDGDSEPGVGVDWEDFLAPLIPNLPLEAAMEVVITGNGFPIDIGIKAVAEVPYNCEIIQATLLADIAGSLVIDVWRDTYGVYPPTNADSITGGNEPTLSGAVKTQNTALTGWTTSLLEGDILAFNVDSCSMITKATLSLKLRRV